MILGRSSRAEARGPVCKIAEPSSEIGELNSLNRNPVLIDHFAGSIVARITCRPPTLPQEGQGSLRRQRSGPEPDKRKGGCHLAGAYCRVIADRRSPDDPLTSKY